MSLQMIDLQNCTLPFEVLRFIEPGRLQNMPSAMVRPPSLFLTVSMLNQSLADHPSTHSQAML